MAVLQSCCCWNSVRKGSFFCGIYTAIYYILNATHSSLLLHSEVKHIRNSSSGREKVSFFNHDVTTTTSLIFDIFNIIFSSGGFITTVILLYGLYTDCKLLLLPWMIAIITYTIFDLTYVTYMFFTHVLHFNPVIAIIITFDLFIISLNVYGLLCVISQYQELSAGRGRALDEHDRIPAIHYRGQTTTTSYISTRKATEFPESLPTPTQSPSCNALRSSPGTEDTSPSFITKGTRKSVKFPHFYSPSKNETLSFESRSDIQKSPQND